MSHAQRFTLLIPPSAFLDKRDYDTCEASVPMPTILPVRAVIRQGKAGRSSEDRATTAAHQERLHGLGDGRTIALRVTNVEDEPGRRVGSGRPVASVGICSGQPDGIEDVPATV